MAVLYVAGLGRCGTSLMMRMLHAAGCPVVGEAPGWEVDEVNHKPVSRAFLQANDGKALKLLTPHLATVPKDFPARTIWMQRSAREQAKSHAKFSNLMLHRPKASRTEIRVRENSLLRDARRGIDALRHTELIRVSFETLVESPEIAIENVACFLGLNVPVVRNAMRSVVVQRPSDCAPDLSIELAALQQVEGFARV